MKERMRKMKELAAKKRSGIAMAAGRGFLIAALVASSLYGAVGCTQKEETVAKKTVAEVPEKEKEEKNFTEKDLEGIVSGIEDHYILVNAKNIDFEHKVTFDKKYVTGVKADASKVDLKKTGKYPLSYTVTVNEEALQAYLDEQAEKDDAKTKQVKADTSDKKDAKESKSMETASDVKKGDTAAEKAEASDTKNEKADASKEDIAKTDTKTVKTADVVMTVSVTVVDKEEAVKLADKGTVVWNDKNGTVPKKDGTKVAEKEKTADAKEAEKKSSDKKDKTTDKAAASTDNKNSGSSGSTGNAGSSSNNNSANTGGGNSGGGNTGGGSSSTGGGGQSNTPSEPEKPAAHTHSWVHHEATGHNEPDYENQWVEDSAAWDEPIYTDTIVCGCGNTFSSFEGWNQHSIDGCMWGYSVKPVQTGSIHHEATGHYEKVQVGSHWVQDAPAYDSCSCGATR